MTRAPLSLLLLLGVSLLGQGPGALKPKVMLGIFGGMGPAATADCYAKVVAATPATKDQEHLPVVLSRDEVRAVLRELEGTHRLMAHLLYGSGLRLLECVRLRVKDLDFAAHQVTVRSGKGDKDRVTMLPDRLVTPLSEHLAIVRRLHQHDLERGAGSVFLPTALERKYPNASIEWGWQYVFPADRLSIDPRSGLRRRHHLSESGLQKAVRRAVQKERRVRPPGPEWSCWRG